MAVITVVRCLLVSRVIIVPVELLARKVMIEFLLMELLTLVLEMVLVLLLLLLLLPKLLMRLMSLLPVVLLLLSLLVLLMMLLLLLMLLLVWRKRAGMRASTGGTFLGGHGGDRRGQRSKGEH